VPASPFETPFQTLNAADFAHLLNHPRVIGLAEMMNYPAVIAGDADALEKLAATGWRNIDGHAPAVTGKGLNAYLTAGPSNDHEVVTLDEALEKRRLGMWVMIREASMIRNLIDLLPLVKEFGTENMLFVTDDREAGTLLHEGHINAMVRLAVEHGLGVGDAVKLATLNVARCHGLGRLGAIAPGYVADICVLPDLVSFVPTFVLKRGTVVVSDGVVATFDAASAPRHVRDTVRVAAMTADDLRVAASMRDTVEIRVVELVPDQVVTRATIVEGTVRDGIIVADPVKDLAKLAVIERHRSTGALGIGFVRGFGLKRGAFAATVAHDAHNVVVAGVNDADMIAAVIRLGELGGGLVVTCDGVVVEEMALPIAGLMSDLPAEEVDAALIRLEQELAGLGVTIGTPFMYLGFLALSVIPELRVTDQGVVDVPAFRLVPLILP
jgi:adenine deaminase